MTNDTNTNEEKKETAAPAKQVKAKIIVTSSKTWDSPMFNWGIHAGETLELPVDEAAQKDILSKPFIKIVK